MWFGTDNGLARFDGRRMQKITIGNGDVDRVLALKTSQNGELWIGTSNGAFSYFHDRFQPVDNTRDVSITAIHLGTSLLLGTDNGFVLRVVGDARSPVAERINSEPIKATDGTSVSVTSVLETEGKILASTAGRGVLVLKGSETQQLGDTPVPGGVNSLISSTSGQLWVGTDAAKGVSGVYSADPNGGGINRIVAPTAKVLAFELNESGLWVGTERYGLFQIVDSKVKKSYTFADTSGGLRSDNIFTLFTDREGVLWIGTNRGASRFDQQGSFQETVSDIPNSNFIRTICTVPSVGEFFYAGSNRGLFRSTVDDKWIEVPALKNRSVYSVMAPNGSTALVGTADGLYDLAGRKLLDGDVRSLGELNSHQYAAVFGRGVFDISSDRPQLIFSNETVTAIGKTSDRLLIGTNANAIYSFDGKTTKLEVDSLKSGMIWKISDSQDDGNAWIGGQHGVFLLRNGAVEQIIAVEDVRDVWANRDEFWAATTTLGLIHGRHDERFGWLSVSIGFEQGLPSEKAFSILPIEGGFLIGTNRGVVMYAPGDIEPKLIPVRILSQRVHDLAEAKSSIPLEYPQNSLLVEVAGQSSRTFPEEFQYAFVLKNSKGEEIARQLSNDAQYAPTDLKPGEYAIEAIAFNRDLLASEPLTISFSVAKAPFPWTATALAVLLALALVALVWAIVEHRRIVQRNRELAAARLDLANEAERERRRIARDLHDQTLADLRNLMMTTDKLPTPAPGVRQEIESISTDIRRICEDLSPSVLENVGLVAALESLLSRTIENSEFTAAEGLEERIAFPLNVQLQIYRIAQEVVANIQRHSNASKVEMTIDVSDANEFTLAIRDDGNAFHPDGLAKRGRGISNIRARANLINGRVAWKESRRGGNVFSLRVGGGNGSV